MGQIWICGLSCENGQGKKWGKACLLLLLPLLCDSSKVYVSIDFLSMLITHCRKLNFLIFLFYESNLIK